jgi:hypothetical protein
LIIFIPIAAGLFVPGALGGITLRLQPVQRPLAVDAARTILNLDGNRNGDGALFPHADHQKRLGEDQSCKVCHHIDLPGDKSSACHLCHSDMHSPSSIFDHQLHADNLGDKWSCEKCHDSRYPKSRENCVSCLECHAEELSEESLRIDQSAFSARSYTDAMHGLCVECHQDSKYADEKPGLADCATCHASAARETDSAQPRIEED